MIVPICLHSQQTCSLQHRPSHHFFVLIIISVLLRLKEVFGRSIHSLAHFFFPFPPQPHSLVYYHAVARLQLHINYEFTY